MTNVKKHESRPTDGIPGAHRADPDGNDGAGRLRIAGNSVDFCESVNPSKPDQMKPPEIRNRIAPTTDAGALTKNSKQDGESASAYSLRVF